MRIPDYEEFTRDWDWFAVDRAGAIGHFTTAGFRKLPSAVKEDWEGAEACIRYFEEEASVVSAYSVTDDLERLVGPFESPARRSHYLRSFVGMAGKGLFSFDTKPLTSGPGSYLLVATPTHPLRLDQLPPPIAALVGRIICPLSFEFMPQIAERNTLEW